jgi:hypothetical protein
LLFLNVYFRFTSFGIEYFIASKLFNPPAYQKFYEMVRFPRTSKSYKIYHRIVGWSGVIVISSSVAVLLWKNFDTANSGRDLFKGAFTLVSITGFVLILIFALPGLVRFLRRVVVDWESNQEAIKRYLLILVLRFWSAVILFFLLVSAVPTIGSALQHFDMQVLRPSFHAKASAELDSLSEMKLVTHDSFLRDTCVQFYSERVRRLDSAMTNISPRSGVVRPLFSSMASIGAGVMAAIALLYLIIPYIWFSGVKRAILYFVILAGSFAIEDGILSWGPRILDVPSDSTAIYLLAALLIFSVTLSLDWIYDALTSPRKLCPVCKADNDEAGLYCIMCGARLTN